MAETRLHLTPRIMGGMNDRLDPEAHAGLRELRNTDTSRGLWAKRPGWLKDNDVAMAATTFIGAHAYRDTTETLHQLQMGGDGVLYHKVTTAAGVVSENWTAVTDYSGVIWGKTHQAVFAEWRDDCFICVGSLDGSGHNLRYAGRDGLLFGVSLDAPATAPTVALGGAGNMTAGSYIYKVTFYDTTTGWQGDVSATATIVIAAGAGTDEVQTLTPDANPTAGTFSIGYGQHATPQIDYNAAPATVQGFMEALPNLNAGDITAGGLALSVGAMTLTFDSALGDVEPVFVIADALIGTDYVTVVETTAGAETTPANAAVALTAIPRYQDVYGAAAHGRTIHRYIFRNDDGAGSARVHIITNDNDLAWTDTNAATTNVGFVVYQAIPVMTQVAVNRNGIVSWANDVTNNEAATIYISYDLNYPEALGTHLYAGEDSDPITGTYAERDGVAIFKRRAQHYAPRQCEACELVVDKGAVAWATIKKIGSRYAWLSPDGPCVIDHGLTEGWRFVGPDPRRFCLADTWKQVQKDRLRYASAAHVEQLGWIVWFVQRCSWDDLVGTDGPHNDTVIVWDYAATSAEHPGGIVQIHDILIDHGYEVPTLTDEWQAWGAFPLGYAGELYHGPHGDGVPTMIEVAVISADGHTIIVDASAYDLGVDGWKGSVFHVVAGAAKRPCVVPIPVCDRPSALIVDHTQGSTTRPITTAAALGVDATSKAWIGGFGRIVDTADIKVGAHNHVANYLRADLHTKGAVT